MRPASTIFFKMWPLFKYKFETPALVYVENFFQKCDTIYGNHVIRLRNAWHCYFLRELVGCECGWRTWGNPNICELHKRVTLSVSCTFNVKYLINRPLYNMLETNRPFSYHNSYLKIFMAFYSRFSRVFLKTIPNEKKLYRDYFLRLNDLDQFIIQKS